MRNLIVALASAAVVAVGMHGNTAAAQDGKELAKTLKCNACHSPTKDRDDAPAYKKSAAKYKGKAGAADQITKTILAQKDHPKLKVSAKEADVKKVVEWILAQ